jgi:hypothetical protein
LTSVLMPHRIEHMFERVERAVAELGAAVAELDADAIPPHSVMRIFELFDHAERHAASGKTLLGRRVDEVQQWKRAGYASAAEYVAAKSGSSVAAARDVLLTSSKLSGLPVLEDALRAGKLSGSQAVAIADAAMTPGAQSRLVNDAQRTSLAELKQECLRTKAAADRNREATRARIHRERYLRCFTDAEGARNMHVRGPIDQVARIETALQPFIDREFEQARREDRREEREACAFDALTELVAAGGGAEASRSRSLRTMMLVRVDLEALQRGEVENDEVCEIPGVGPIAISAARAVLGESILKLVITRGVDVVNVTHLGRGPTDAQKIAVLFRQPVCIVEGCNRTRIEFDHRTPWAQTHYTRVDDLQGPCHHHHRLKTVYGWELVDGTVKRPMVPPDDPRHPNNKNMNKAPP